MKTIRMGISKRAITHKENAGMIWAVLFWLFLISAVFVAISQGRRPDRIFAAALVMAVISTYFLNVLLGWDAAHIFILAIDSILLLVSLLFVWKLDSFWPIWFSSFQAIAVATSVAQLTFPNELPALYTNMQGFWFFPALISMVVGIVMDNQKQSLT